MSDPTPAVQNLHKVALLLEAGRRENDMDLTAEPEPFSFIFGTGIEGLSPFEYRLHDRRAGETVDIEVRAGEIHRQFEHLAPPLVRRLSHLERFYLRARVERVEPADNREIVKALAGGGGCGGDCECGCGCD